MIEIIKNIISEKIKRNKSPAYALYSEILREAKNRGIPTEEAKKGLRALKDNEHIAVGRTLNDYWVKVK